MSYAPVMEWLCQEYIIHKQLAQFSLVVESNFAMVLSVEAASLQTKIPLDVRDKLNSKSFIRLDWIQKRSEEILDGAYPYYVEDLENVKSQVKTKMNYPLSSRVVMKKLCNKDLSSVNGNLPELLSLQKRHLGQKRIDDENPNRISDKVNDITPVYEQTNHNLRGHL